MNYGDFLQLGAVAIIFLFAIREFFQWLKSRNNKNGWNRKMFEELKLLNQNHLNSIERAIYDGNDKVVEAINQGNQKIIELLGEIKGRISK